MRSCLAGNLTKILCAQKYYQNHLLFFFIAVIEKKLLDGAISKRIVDCLCHFHCKARVKRGKSRLSKRGHDLPLLHHRADEFDGGGHKIPSSMSFVPLPFIAA